MIIPWFFYFFRKENYRASLLLVILILISKENISLWMIFIAGGLALEYRRKKKAVGWIGIFTLISIMYFILIVGFIMPSFSASGNYNGFTYSTLGNTPLDAFSNLIHHPIQNSKILFTNHIDHPKGDYVKLELHILVLVSGLYLLFAKPAYLIMLIPIYIQKMFHDSYRIWGIDEQYSIEFAPILILGAFSVIAGIRNANLKWIMAIAVIAGILLSTMRVMDRTIIYTDKSRIRFYTANHYHRDYNVKEVHSVLNSIPGNAAVSALSPFVPHLALRENIYQFPIINNADYIVFSWKEKKYPLDEEGFRQEINKLMANGPWKITYESESVTILKRD